MLMHACPARTGQQQVTRIAIALSVAKCECVCVFYLRKVCTFGDSATSRFTTGKFELKQLGAFSQVVHIGFFVLRPMFAWLTVFVSLLWCSTSRVPPAFMADNMMRGRGLIENKRPCRPFARCQIHPTVNPGTTHWLCCLTDLSIGHLPCQYFGDRMAGLTCHIQMVLDACLLYHIYTRYQLHDR